MFSPRPIAATTLLLALAACSGGGGDGAPAATDASAGGTGRPASLAAELGCGACHAGMPEPELVRRRAPVLGEDGRRPPAGFLFRYLRDPVAQRSDIGRSRMPDFHLDTAEAAALTLFLLDRQGTPLAGDGGPEPLRRARELAGVDAARGGRIYRALNCAGCHRGIGVEAWENAPPLGRERARAREGWLGTWLRRPEAIRPYGFRPGTGSRMPDFQLTAGEADSLVAELVGSADAGSGDVDGVDARSADAGGGDDGGLEPPSPYEAAKAEALLRRRLPCLGCHRLGGEGGRIGPALDEVASRRPDPYVLGMIRDPAVHAPGTIMPPVPMAPGRARLVARYLLGFAGRPPSGEEPERPRRGYLSLVDHPIRAPESHEVRPSGRATAESEPPESGPEGEALYRSSCAACHGRRGDGNGYNARYLPVRPTPHGSGDAMSGRPDATLFDGIHAGGRILGRSHFMPPFGERLERDRIWSLVRHIRDLCDCRGPGWSRDGREAPWRR